MKEYYYVKTTDEFGSTVSVIEYKLIKESNTFSLTYLTGKCADCGTNSHETGSGHCWGTQYEQFEEIEKSFVNGNYITS